LLAVSKATHQEYPCIPHIASGFAVGLGGMGEMSGAVSSSVLVIGLIHGQSQNSGLKVREFVQGFVEQNGAIRCIDLIGLDESDADLLLETALDLKNDICDGLVTSAVQEVLKVLEYSE
jgi:C_GCAxxG_C_C family probable redox protein